MIIKPTNIVHQRDCMEEMWKYPDGYFDILLADVPYGIKVAQMAYLREMNTKVKQKNGTKLNGNRNKKPYTIKDWDKTPPPQAYYDEVKRISKVQIIFGVNYVDWKGLGTGRIKWDKGFAKGMSFNRYEYAYCSSIEGEVEIKLLWAGMMQAKSLSEPMVQKGNKKLNEKRRHPCHKPVLLYQKLIQDYAFNGCKILDTHVGGGSSRIAAHLHDCEYVGFEIDEEYWNEQEEGYNLYLQGKLPELFT